MASGRWLGVDGGPRAAPICVTAKLNFSSLINEECLVQIFDSQEHFGNTAMMFYSWLFNLPDLPKTNILL